jgi:acetolactate synthase-1/2/3 large subunit
MDPLMPSFSRRDVLKVAAAHALLALPAGSSGGGVARRHARTGWVKGHMTGAEALVETLQVEGAECVFGIPGAQENELWDAMKAKRLGYLLVTHEFSAAVMADGYARSTGKPGVLAVVPGPGVTNSLTGLGEALLDSVPIVCVVGDVARGEKYRPFQVHELPNAALLKPVTKQVIEVTHASEIPLRVRQAFQLARAGEPGPVAVVVPYNLLMAAENYDSPPLEGLALPFDEPAFNQTLGLLTGRRRVGIYAGLGCMDHSPALVRLAETLQAPVATSVSGKGVIPEDHPLAVGWGYGPQGTCTAEEVFQCVDVVLAIGVRYSEVSTGFYSIPKHRHVIHVDINADNLGRVIPTDVCVHADAGLFLDRLHQHAGIIGRPHDGKLHQRIARLKARELQCNATPVSRRKPGPNVPCGVDPMHLVLALRRCCGTDALVFVDVALAEHLAAEAFQTCLPRTYFNPTNNQSMGWSIPAALGAQKVHPGRQVVTITGDGCFLMSAMEISTAAREHLPVKFFILDDQAYQYMQALQKAAYRRTTATILARLDYRSLAHGFGVGYLEITVAEQLDEGIRAALDFPGPVLVRVLTDYRGRQVRWIEAVKDRFTDELSATQKMRFAARLGSRSLDISPEND